MTTWKIDPAHTDVLFSAKHMMVTTVRGTFKGVDGELEIDEANPAASRGEIRVDVASIDTQNDQRDGHLRSADFFLAEEYPQIVGKVAKVEKAGSAWKVTVEVVLLIVRLVKLTGALNSVVPEFWMVTAIEPERGAFTFTAPALPPLRDSVARLVVVTV